MRLSAYDWPGNVRQLRSAVERLFVLSRSEKLTDGDLKMALEPTAGAASTATEPYFDQPDYREAKRLFEVEYLSRKLREHGGNVTRTAAAIGPERQSLQEKSRQLGVPRD